jgi:asparagine synthetase B (glutamine-hydrolysing)
MLAPNESYCTEFFGQEKIAALNAIEPRIRTLDESIALLRCAMEKSLAFWLPKGRTIGVLVGGVDGALIVSLVKQFGLEPVVCTAGTAKSDDIQSAKSLSQVFSTPFIPVILDGVDLNPRLRVAIERLQYCGLFSITSAILLDFCLEKCASAGIEYLLTGNGVDLLYGGGVSAETVQMQRGPTFHERF